MSSAKSEDTTKKTTDESKQPAHQAGNKLDPNLLEEDDEFEEFPVQDWKGQADDDDAELNVWEDNWDDEAIEDDFSKQLRAELEKTGGK